MSADKDLNRLKVVLVEKKKSSLWLSRQLGCAPTTVSIVGGRISELVNSKFGDTI